MVIGDPPRRRRDDRSAARSAPNPRGGSGAHAGPRAPSSATIGPLGVAVGRRQTEPKSRSTMPSTSMPPTSPGDDERGPGRIERRPVGRLRGRRGRAARTVSSRSATGAVVRRVVGVDRLGERFVRATARVGARLEQVIQALVAKPVHLATPGRWAGGPPPPAARARPRGGSAGTSTPADIASQLASAWRLAPRRSAASTSSIASYRSVPSVSARAARIVAPAVLRRLVDGAVRAGPATALTSGRPGRSAVTRLNAVREASRVERRELVRPRRARASAGSR